MPISFAAPLSSATANATWLDKTQDDATVGLLALNNPGSTSIADPQLQINKSRKVLFGESAKANASQLTPNSESMFQEFRLIGDGAAITLNVLPFSAQPQDGTEIILVGHSDTDTVTITSSDTQYSAYINGDATLKRGYILKLIYNDELERYLETSRNF